MRPVCPACRADIPPEGINAFEDVGHCKVCNTLHTLSELVNLRIDPAAFLHDPPDGTFEREELDGWVVGASMRKVVAAIFLGGFAVGWNAIVIGITAAAVTNIPALSGWTVLIAIATMTPFLLIGIGLLVLAAIHMFGWQEVRVRAGIGEVFTGIGGFGRRRRFDPGLVQSVSIESEVSRSPEGSTHTSRYIEIVADKRIRIGRGMPQERLDWFLAVLRDRLVGSSGIR